MYPTMMSIPLNVLPPIHSFIKVDLSGNDIGASGGRALFESLMQRQDEGLPRWEMWREEPGGAKRATWGCRALCEALIQRQEILGFRGEEPLIMV